MPDSLAGRGWRHVLIVLALPWLAGILTRSVWTPDEPREYALSVNMLSHSQWAVPHLGGQPFGEKPSLSVGTIGPSDRVGCNTGLF